jgi:hypothetical protein
MPFWICNGGKMKEIICPKQLMCNYQHMVLSFHSNFTIMKIKLFTALAICFASFASCVAQKSEMTSAQRSVEPFTVLSISGGFGKSTLKQGTPGVKVMTEDKWLQYIVTETDGNELKIYFKKGSPKDIRAALVISFDQITEINNSGSTDLEAVDPIKGRKLEFNYSGSGNFVGGIDVDRLDINISGSSDFQIKGKADRQEYAISGSGDIDANQLQGKEAEVAISGSGDVELNISGNVQMATSGSGRVRNRN